MYSCLCLSVDNTDTRWDFGKNRWLYICWWILVNDYGASMRHESGGEVGYSSSCGACPPFTNPSLNWRKLSRFQDWFRDDWCSPQWGSLWWGGIHILALQDDGLESDHLILSFLILIQECGCEFIEGEMWLFGIVEQIFLNLRDVSLLVIGISNESFQRCEGDNDSWVERMGRVELGSQQLHTTGLVHPNHHRQTLRTILTVARHLKLGTENNERKYCEKQISDAFPYRTLHFWESMFSF